MKIKIGIKTESLAAVTHKLAVMLADSSKRYIKELLADHESIIIYLRENISRFANEYHDLETSGFITGLMETHGKKSVNDWFPFIFIK